MAKAKKVVRKEKKEKLVEVVVKYPGYVLINGKLFDYRDKVGKKAKMPERVAKLLEERAKTHA